MTNFATILLRGGRRGRSVSVLVHDAVDYYYTTLAEGRRRRRRKKRRRRR